MDNGPSGLYRWTHREDRGPLPSRYSRDGDLPRQSSDAFRPNPPRTLRGPLPILGDSKVDLPRNSRVAGPLESGHVYPGTRGDVTTHSTPALRCARLESRPEVGCGETRGSDTETQLHSTPDHLFLPRGSTGRLGEGGKRPEGAPAPREPVGSERPTAPVPPELPRTGRLVELDAQGHNVDEGAGEGVTQGRRGRLGPSWSGG